MYILESLRFLTEFYSQYNYLAKARFKRRILHAPNQILILVDSN